MKPTGRTILDSFAVMAGVFLLVNELRDFGGGEGWFWLFVAVMIIVLGMIDLAAVMKGKR